MKRSRFCRRADHRDFEGARGRYSGLEQCRKHGVSDASIYKWKARFGGLEVSEAKKLRALEDENAKLKRMLADAMLDNVASKDLLEKCDDARTLAKSCRLSRVRPRDERTAGV